MLSSWEQIRMHTVHSYILTRGGFAYFHICNTLMRQRVDVHIVFWCVICVFFAEKPLQDWKRPRYAGEDPGMQATNKLKSMCITPCLGAEIPQLHIWLAFVELTFSPGILLYLAKQTCSRFFSWNFNANVCANCIAIDLESAIFTNMTLAYSLVHTISFFYICGFLSRVCMLRQAPLLNSGIILISPLLLLPPCWALNWSLSFWFVFLETPPH